MRLGRTTIVYFLSQAALSLAGFLATLYIARTLGAAVLGTYALVIAVLLWVNIPTSALGNAINKRLSEGSSQGEFVSAGALLTVIVFAVVVSLIFLFAGLINAYVGAEVHWLLALLFVGTGTFRTLRSILKGRKRVATAGGLQALERVVRTGAQVGFIVLGYELSGIIFGHIGSLFLTILISVPILGLRPTVPSKEHFASLLEYARYSWLGTLQDRSFSWMDTIVLGFFVAPQLIGIYEVAWSITSVLALIGVSISHTLFPEISSLGEAGDIDEIHHLLNEGLAFTGVFAIPGLLGAIVIGPRLLRIYRPEFVRGAQILIILIVARLLALYGLQFINAVNGYDRPDIAFQINLMFIGANLLLNVILVYLFGWYGAAFATLLSAALMLTAGYIALRKLIGTPSVPFDTITREFGAALGMAGVILLLMRYLPQNHYSTIAMVLFGAGCYGMLLITISKRVRDKALMLLPFDSNPSIRL